MTFKSRKHIVNFYLTAYGSFIFIGLLSLITILIFKVEYQKPNAPFKLFFLPVIGFSVFMMGVKVLIDYLRATPDIEMQDGKLIVRRLRTKAEFLLEDITSIEFSGVFDTEIPFASRDKTALRIQCGEKQWLFFDDFYSNLWQLKMYLGKKWGTGDAYEVMPPLRSEYQLESFQNHKGYQLFNLNGLLLWGLSSFFLYIYLSHKSGIVPAVLFFVFFFFLVSRLLYFFQTSENFLVVKNHNFFWFRNIYRLSDIRQVIIEQGSKKPYTLRIVTKDFKQSEYAASTLRKKHWNELAVVLRSKGIPITDNLHILNDV